MVVMHGINTVLSRASVAVILLGVLSAGCGGREGSIKRVDYDPSRDPGLQTYKKVSDLYARSDRRAKTYGEEYEEILNTREEFWQYRQMREFLEKERLGEQAENKPSIEEQYRERRAQLMTEIRRIVSRYLTVKEQRKARELRRQAWKLMLEVVRMDEQAELRDFAILEDYVETKRRELYERYKDPEGLAEMMVEDLIRELR